MLPKQRFFIAGRFAILVSVSMALVLGMRLLLSLLTRLPLIAPYLYSFDSINFALALKQFAPTRNQPQPPGYPFFVGEARLLYHWLGSPEQTFFFLEIAISGLSVAMLYILGKRMFSPKIAFVAAALLFVNPTFWFSALTSPLRPHLALLSALVAYLCWRALSGEQHYFYVASAALGLASGFRPELLPVLLPLWAWTGWHLRYRAVKLFRGTVLVGITTLIWVAILIVASGGLHHLAVFYSEYLFTQTQQTSVLMDPRSSSWLRWAGRGVLWNALGVVPWIWTVPFGWWQRKTVPQWKQLLTFLALWFLPAFAFHLAVHVDEPDHVLSTIPVLCLLGGFCVVAAGDRIVQLWPEFKEGTAVVITIVLAGNLLLFFGQFPVPQRGRASGFRGWQSVEDAVLIGTYESSYARVRWVNQMMELAMQRIQDLKATAAGRPILLIWARDGEPVWRKVCFYLPSERVYSLDEQGDPAVPVSLAQLWSGGNELARHSGSAPIRIPVPDGSRVIWIIAPVAAESLQRAVSLQKAAPLYYTDLPRGTGGFQWGSFEFVPQ